MTKLGDAVREVLTGGRPAHLVTLNADGSPQVTVVWVGLDRGPDDDGDGDGDGDGDEIVCAHLAESHKVRNIRGDARVALSMATGTRNQMGLDEYLVVYGTARITEGGAPELLQRLAEVYLGADVRFPPMDNPPTGFVTRITVERLGGVGPWGPMAGRGS